MPGAIGGAYRGPYGGRGERERGRATATAGRAVLDRAPGTRGTGGTHAGPGYTPPIPRRGRAL